MLVLPIIIHASIMLDDKQKFTITVTITIAITIVIVVIIISIITILTIIIMITMSIFRFNYNYCKTASRMLATAESNSGLYMRKAPRLAELQREGPWTALRSLDLDSLDGKRESVTLRVAV